jgi:hypothetical protein
MATYCERCKVQVHGLPEHQPHLCADLERRLVRRERQVQAVLSVFSSRGLLDGYEQTQRDIAEAIVKALSNLGVDSD